MLRHVLKELSTNAARHARARLPHQLPVLPPSLGSPAEAANFTSASVTICRRASQTPSLLPSRAAPPHRGPFRPPRSYCTSSPPGGSAASTAAGAGATAGTHAAKQALAETRPPFAVRAALVGTAVGLGTPLFATAGVAVAWYRLLPKWGGNSVKAVIGVCIGGGLWKLLYSHVGPFLYNHGELVLPFALANAITATAWYAALEARYGLELMAGHLNEARVAEVAGGPVISRWIGAMTAFALPVGGPLVGFLTAVSAGFLFPPLASWLWPADMKAVLAGPTGGLDWLVDLHLELMVPVSVPVGIVAGYGVHTLLAPFLLGSVGGGGLPWTQAALPLLLGLGAAAGAYFLTCRTWDSDNFWETRLDPASGRAYRRNLRTGKVKEPAGSASPAYLPGSSHVSDVGSPFVHAGRVREMQELGRLMQAPLKNFVDYVQGKTLVPCGGVALPAEDARLPLERLPEHHAVQYTFDLLIRLRHLKQLQAQGQGGDEHAAEVAALQQAAHRHLGMDLDGLLHHLELVVIAAAENNTSNVQRLHADMKNKVLASTGSVDTRWGIAGDDWARQVLGADGSEALLRGLHTNADVLGRRFQDEIGYYPTKQKAARAEMRAWRFKKLQETAVDLSLKAVGGLALLAVAKFLLMFSLF